MWIKKEKFEKMQRDSQLLQALENQNRPWLKYGVFYTDNSLLKRYDEIVQSFQPEMISFKDYYAERLEWWKKRFDKKPENHKLRIGWNDDFKIIEKNNMEAIEQTLNWFKKQKDFIEIEDFETNRKVVIPVNQIQDYAVIPGHPEPYSEEEIEAWAKEQLEKEMQRWKVVKEDIQIRKGYQFVTDLNERYANYIRGMIE